MPRRDPASPTPLSGLKGGLYGIPETDGVGVSLVLLLQGRRRGKRWRVVGGLVLVASRALVVISTSNAPLRPSSTSRTV